MPEARAAVLSAVMLTSALPSSKAGTEQICSRTTRHPGYAISQRLRKRIEEPIGWAKSVAGLTKIRHRGLERVGWMFHPAIAAGNLIRLPKLLDPA